ncbi:fatty-acid amide hydrolase 2-like isoform X2 [Mya arenaria]|nr:fatty-acid amide hydrolase 2-like isoform X2 [Mya arenaria]XP_052811558.1 fatty-acid amide hydrolase 2-like isoform X2 [Mya arenaria]XP_052811559.1 fatty-acid amide hydrolase 2-like isoform X2 [Mya arenaria]
MGAAKLIQLLLHYVLMVVGWVWVPVTESLFSSWYDGSAETVSPVEDEVLLDSATSLARKIRSRELKAADVMERFISRVEKCKDLLNVVVYTLYDKALAEAHELDRQLDADNKDDRFSEENMPLLGVPLSVKEAFAVKGMPNCSGLVSRKDYRSECDCPVVSRLRAAGAIPFCLTNTSELCMWYESANWVYGRSKNPYNTGRIVGGSSGGEAGNVGSGGALIGIGSDIGGSIRMPAFFCGIFGHRPSRGFVPNEGQFPMAGGREQDLLSTGPMCRYMEDIVPTLKVMAGKDEQVDLNKKVDVSKLTVYNIEDDGGSLLLSKVDPQLKEAQARAVHYLQTSAGVTVKTMKVEKFKYAFEMWSARMTTAEGKNSFQALLGGENGKINPLVELLKWFVHCSNHTLPAITLGLVESLNPLLEGSNKRSLKGLEKLEEEMKEMLDENSVILYPTHPKIAPYHNQPILYPFNWAYTGLFNALGLPVTAVPLGLDKKGLPLGIQIVAGMNYDRVSIAVAQELAKGNVARWVNPGT